MDTELSASWPFLSPLASLLASSRPVAAPCLSVGCCPTLPTPFHSRRSSSFRTPDPRRPLCLLARTRRGKATLPSVASPYASSSCLRPACRQQTRRQCLVLLFVGVLRIDSVRETGAAAHPSTPVSSIVLSSRATADCQCAGNGGRRSSAVVSTRRRRYVKGPMVEACTSRVLPVTQLQFYHNLPILTNQPTYERLRRLENTRMTSVTTDGSDELMRSYGTIAMLLALGLALRRNWEQRKYRKWRAFPKRSNFKLRLFNRPITAILLNPRILTKARTVTIPGDHVKDECNNWSC